jgi:hypothetical protein
MDRPGLLPGELAESGPPRPRPWWLTATYRAAIIPADFIMAMGMLRGLRKRAETQVAG